MVSRTRSDKQSNVSFEIQGLTLADIERRQQAMANQMMADTGSGIAAPTPSLPFKIAETGDRSGVEISVSVKIPKNTGIVRIQLIRKDNNRIKDGETMEQAKARALEQVKPFRIEVTEPERMAGVVVRRIGPLPVSDDSERNKYQLCRLVGKSADEGDLVFNPKASPYDNFPFDVFKVRTDGANDDENKFFTIGDVAIGATPSAPAANLIVGNAVNSTTQAADATVTFKIFASAADNTKTFAALDITECFIRIRPFSMAEDPMGDTDAQTYPAVIDPSKTFVLISAVLPLGERYKWTRVVTKNGAGKMVSTPMTDVDFYAGGTPATNGIPELEAFTISVTPKNSTHSLVTCTIKQFANSMSHPFAVLLKRIAITVLEPTDDPLTTKPQYKIPLLAEEDVFIQGNTTAFTQKVVHRANMNLITFKATVFAINHTTATPIKRDATDATGTSMLNLDVLEPAAQDLVGNAVDGDMSEMRSLATFRLWATPTRAAGGSFADINITKAGIYLRRVKTTNNTNDTSDSDTEITEYSVTIEDRSQKFVDLKVPNLATARKYRWRRTFLSNDTGIALSDQGVFVEFIAGTGLVDTNLLTLYAPVITVQNKMFATITCQFDQPASGMPVALKNIDLQRKRPQDADYMTIANGRVVLREVAGFSSNTTVVPPSTNGFQKFVVYEFNHKPKQTNLYQYVIRAIGNDSRTSPPSSANSGDDSPGITGTTVPSAPANMDIITNEINGDPTAGNARVVLRVWASELRNNVLASIGRAPTWDDVNATMAFSRIKGVADMGEPNQQGGAVDPASTFLDIEYNLPLGKQYNWTRNIASNGVNSPAIATATFFAGGGVDLTGLTITIASFNTIDPRHTEFTVNIVQPSPAILFKRIVLFKQVVNRNASPVNADSLRALDDETLLTPGLKTVVLTSKHPQSCVLNVFVTIFGVNGTSKSTPVTVVNIGSDGGAPPTAAPSAPSLGLLTNTTGDDPSGTEGITVARIFAEATQTMTFQQIGAISCTAIFARTSTGNKITCGGDLDDAQAASTFVDIECPELKLMKTYSWLKNINANGNGRQVSTGSNVNFIAGGFSGSIFNILNFAVQSVNNYDDRASEVFVTFQQNGAALVFLSDIKLFQQQSGVPGDTLHVVDSVDISKLTDESTGTKYNSAGVHTYRFTIKHKRPPNTVTVRARLRAAAGGTIDTAPFSFNVSAIDSNIPQWVNVPSTVKYRWKLNSNTLRIHLLNKPDANVRTLVTIKALMEFDINNGISYVWNPKLDQGADFTVGTIGSLLSQFSTSPFFIDAGGAIDLVFNKDKPVFSGTPNAGDLPPTIFNALQSFGGDLIVYFAAQNEFQGPSNVGVTATTVFNFPGNA